MAAAIRAAAVLYLATLSDAFGSTLFERTSSRRNSHARQRGVTALNSFGFKNPFAPKRSEEKAVVPAASFDVGTLKANTEPRPFRVAPSLAFDVALAAVPFILRAGSGALASGYRIEISDRDDSVYSALSLGNYQLLEVCDPVPPDDANLQPVILYEFEGCPFCRKVREAISILSLEAKYLPCPKKSVRFRSVVKEKYGKSATFPFMIDPNTGVKLFESDEIVSYLFQNYGPYKNVPKILSSGALTTATCALGLLPRFGSGGEAKTAKPAPREALVLWAYESSPFCKLVREELTELQLPHVQISCPRGSPNRQKLFQKTGGRFQVPYLEDANSGVALFETEAILEYLRSQYGVEPSPVKYI